jgi:hypothetical protein
MAVIFFGGGLVKSTWLGVEAHFKGFGELKFVGSGSIFGGPELS